MAFGQLSLRGRALRLLSQREHSRSELAAKLARHVDLEDPSAAQALIEQTIAELAEHGWVSDERTAASVLQAKRQRFGALKIGQLLQAKGLAPELIASTLRQARAAELQAARQIWQRRFGEPPHDARERARQQRFLAGRGFSAETVRQVMAGTSGEHDAHDAQAASEAQAQEAQEPQSAHP